MTNALYLCSFVWVTASSNNRQPIPNTQTEDETNFEKKKPPPIHKVEGKIFNILLHTWYAHILPPLKDEGKKRKKDYLFTGDNDDETAAISVE